MKSVKILPQPNDTTCGPTALHAVYNYYGDVISLEKVINGVHALKEGGTLAVLLACHALERGYNASIYTYNLKLFDPTWNVSDKREIIQKLIHQKKSKKGKKLHKATQAYINFLNLGGNLYYEDLDVHLFDKFFKMEQPILTGLSATYLYNCKRETTNSKNESIYDDLRGFPTGHFVVLNGFDEKQNVIVADPYQENPVSYGNYYSVNPQRLINAIMLGIVTYDANLLIISPKSK